LQIRVLVFSKFSGSIKFGIFSGGSFPNLYFFKIGSWFLFKKFCVKFSQVSIIGFKVFNLDFGKHAVSFGKVYFLWLAFFLVKSGFQNRLHFFSKNFSKFVSGFFARFIFSGINHGLQSQFLAKVSASSWLLRFGKSV